MAKLKCDAHKLRVFALNGKFLHRGGWGTVCTSPTATIGDKTYTPEEILLMGKHSPPVKLRPKADDG